ncbi:chromosome segregation protein SMC [Rhodobacteraceae bacterium WD3A24]|nr:chromosome segregation protein SMC [Rhodobacteraceae bacterium WD3A24]
MHFTRLRLNGFKSFVDPTDLVIREGLTGVVGPNGCGKSNLLEALRWVMGENRPTAMRGGGMEDVIFAGTASRPARNFAEVTLHLDNADRLAPTGFNDSDLLEVTRRITRDAGSAYKANGREARARDVQMLFADASTGAHSPALVRQGQIAELINARPRARRRVLEEAAGISGLYQRRHEAELKLNSTESNLERVEDVIDGLAGQLQQLARQAKQAARYRELGAQLRRAEGLLLYRRWKEDDAARAAAEETLAEAVREAGRTEAAAGAAARAHAEREQALPPLREEEAVAGAILQRLEVQRATLAEEEARARETIRTLEARIDQLASDREREAGLNRDAGETIARLEREQADLAQAAEGHDARLSNAETQASDAAETLQAAETTLSELTEDTARLAARHQAGQRRRDEARQTLDRSTAEAARAREQADTADTAKAQAETDHAAAEAALDEAQRLASAAEQSLTEAEEARGAAQAREAEARATHAEAEGEAGALRAEVAALARLVENEADTGDHLLDRITVAPGFEAALGAALGDDLRAGEIDAAETAVASGWAALPACAEAPAPLPEGAAPLVPHVQAPDVLARRLPRIGVVERADGGRLQPLLAPGQRLVSAEGDLWRWDGYRAASDDAPSAAALRLQQINRLSRLRQEHTAAAARAESALQAHETLKRRAAELDEADRRARETRRDADARVAQARRALSQAEADRSRSEDELESAQRAVARHEDAAAQARAELDAAEAALAELGDLDAARAGVEEARQAVEAARTTMMHRRAAHEELRREGRARDSRAREIATEIDGWRRRLETAEHRIAELDSRLEASRAQLAEAREAPERIGEKRAELDTAVDAAEARRKRAADALAQGESALRAAATEERESERAAGTAREARARAEARLEAARETAAQAEQRIRDETGSGPQELLETLAADADEMAETPALEAEVARLRRARDALGAVNLRAEEDAREVQDEHDALVSERADLQAAVAKLRNGIGALNREGRERLLAAFEQVNASFSALFSHLFDGGEARLVLVESDDPLEAGLEIMCQPPGKKLSTLSLLSGGEQTLTALALIFAVFLANPAPICVLDEVDAPLDDANVTRFCNLLDEMTRRTETRFLIITHNAITMSRMDRLFGVTMGEQGVSQLVSVDLNRAEQMVA